MPTHKILVVDFDGTIVEHKFPKIGLPYRHAFPVLRALRRRYQLVLNTCREDRMDSLYSQPGDEFPMPTGVWKHNDQHYLRHAVEFCEKHGVTWDAVNEPIVSADYRDDHFKRRKPYGDVYIDDKNFGGIRSWVMIGEVLLPADELEAALNEPEPYKTAMTLEPNYFAIPSIFR